MGACLFIFYSSEVLLKTSNCQISVSEWAYSIVKGLPRVRFPPRPPLFLPHLQAAGWLLWWRRLATPTPRPMQKVPSTSKTRFRGVKWWLQARTSIMQATKWRFHTMSVVLRCTLTRFGQNGVRHKKPMASSEGSALVAMTVSAGGEAPPLTFPKGREFILGVFKAFR